MARYADTSNYSEAENKLWEQLIENQGNVYHTSKGLEFQYGIVGNEMFVERKEKSITRSTVNLAYRRATELQVVTGPKKLSGFGASYLYPCFLNWEYVDKSKQQRKLRKIKECGWRDPAQEN